MSGCATWKPPAIQYDNTPKQAVAAPDPPKPVQIVEIPKPLPLPDQLKPLPVETKPLPEARNPRIRVDDANKAARVQPTRADYINAVQVYPFSDGALYQVYAAPGEVTDVSLEAGEQLVGTGPVAAGDTVRWVIGDTESGTRYHQARPYPAQADAGRPYHQPCDQYRPAHLSPGTALCGQDLYGVRLVCLSRRTSSSRFAPQNQSAETAQPLDRGIDVNALAFRYSLQGDNPPWRPSALSTTASTSIIEFPSGIGQGEMPPLWVIGAQGGGELVNYRVRGAYMIVDRLFAAAELRLGADPQQIVRIVRTDGKKPS